MSRTRHRLADLSPGQKRELLAQLLRQEQRESHTFPLSFGQQRLWFLDQLEPGCAVYHLPAAWRFRGVLNIAALRQSLDEIVRRHDILRTTFPAVDGQPVQVVAPEVTLMLPVVDCQQYPETERETIVQQRAVQEIRQPFDLARGPLLRAILMRLAAEDYVLLLTIHHIVFDGWSFEVFWRELTALYTAFCHGQPSPLSALAIQYGDFAVWQRQWLQGTALETQLTYWKHQLGGPLPVLQLPTDRPDLTARTSRGACQYLVLPLQLSEALKTLSQQEGVTLFMTLLTVFKTLLYRYTGQDDLLVGTPIAGRTRVEAESLTGFFVNTLVLRTAVGGNPRFRDLLGRVREVALSAYDHQELPFEKLVEVLQPERHLNRNPLFQVMFILHNAPTPIRKLPGLTVEPMTVASDTAAFAVTLSIRDTGQGLRGELEYRTDLFDSATIARMLGHFQLLLRGVVDNPEQRIADLPLLTKAERQQLLVAWNDTQVTSPSNRCIHDLFEEQVARTPDAVAVMFDEAQLTYRALNHRANQLAHWLQAQGIGPEGVVGLCVERSPEMLVSLLGILKAGGVYVPLDPDDPTARLASILSDTQTSVVLTQQRLVSRLPKSESRVICLDADWPTIARESPRNLDTEVDATQLAYIMYTSGSTGTPKGVMIQHRSLTAFTQAAQAAYTFNQGSRVLQFAPISFDAAGEEIYPCLLSGGAIVLRTEAMMRSVPAFLQQCQTWRVSVLMLPTAYWHVVTAELSQANLGMPDAVRLVIIGGERALPERARLWWDHVGAEPVLINTYGPTEATVVATRYSLTAWRSQHGERLEVPIGRPTPHGQVYILDHRLSPVPIGVVGELYLGGEGLARGYWHSPDLTAERFIPHPFSDVSNTRLYKTGDRVRYLADGNLEFVGRVDEQVKIRGFRVELGEIESALHQHPSVRQSVVVARPGPPGPMQVVAYVALRDETTHTADLRTHLQQKLPNYMMPTAFVRLDALPLTPNGKINRRALPAPAPSEPATGYAPPRTPTEDVLANIWCEVLGRERVGRDDNFFDLGGHSLLAMQILSRLQDALQVDVPLRALLDVPTVAGLALHIETARQTGRSISIPALLAMPRQGKVPMSVAQEHVWHFDQVLPGTPFFTLFSAIRLTGALHVAVLEQSVNEIIRRHEVLRTTFASVDGQPVQVIAPSLHVPLTTADLRDLRPTEREAEAYRLTCLEVLHPFDLAQGPLIRVLLLQLAARECTLIVTMSHIISDGWSVGVFVHELALLYHAFSGASSSPLPALPVQYADFARWQRELRCTDAGAAQLDYWKKQLCHPLPVLELPSDRPRTATLSFRTARQALQLPRALSDALTRLGHREGSTLFMTLVAAFKILLHGYTGQEDLRLGTLLANRHRPEVEGLIGLFVNTVLLRTDLSGNPTLRQVLQRVRATTLAAHAHQHLPFEEVVRTLEREHALQRTSLCQVMFIWQYTLPAPPQLPDLTLSVLEMDDNVGGPGWTATAFDIVLTLSENPQGLTGSCIYKTALFDAPTITRMLQDFQDVLECLVSQPEQPISIFNALSHERG